MAVRYPRLFPLGDVGFTIEFGGDLDPSVHDRVTGFAARVRRQRLPGLIEIVPTYRAVAVYLDPRLADWRTLSERLLLLATKPHRGRARPGRLVTIPVCYGGRYGPDLSAVARRAKLAEAEAVALHAGVVYRVYMLGFTPGFPYMGTVPEPIAAPRLSTPRASVPAGSVGIAGRQTGVYPQSTPGGWRIIGRTPLKLYDPARADPFLLRAGDEVRFAAIDEQEFARLAEGS